MNEPQVVDPCHRVLLVEDNGGVQKSYRRILKDLGLAVECASTREQALEILVRFQGRFCLAMIDQHIPSTSHTNPELRIGQELAADVRRLWPQIAVLSLTGHGDDHWNCQAALEAGVHAFFKKGTTRVSLREVILALLGKHCREPCPYLAQASALASHYTFPFPLLLDGGPFKRTRHRIEVGTTPKPTVIGATDQWFTILYRLHRANRVRLDGFVLPVDLFKFNENKHGYDVIARHVRELEARFGVTGLVETVPKRGVRLLCDPARVEVNDLAIKLNLNWTDAGLLWEPPPLPGAVALPGAGDRLATNRRQSS